MKSFIRTVLASKATVRAGLVACLLSLCCIGSVQAQTIFLDFRFDENDGGSGFSGTDATSLGQQTVQLTAGSSQTYTVDIWATVVSTTQTNVNNYSFNQLHVRGISDIFSNLQQGTGGGTGNSAFTVGGTAGVGASSTFVGPPASPTDHSGTVTTVDNGSTSNNGGTVTPGADGIIDFGKTGSNVLNDYATTHPGFISATASQAGIANETGRGGFSFLVGQFQFTAGAASGSAGSVTAFFPTQSGSGTIAEFALNPAGTSPVILSAGSASFVIDANSALRFGIASTGAAKAANQVYLPTYPDSGAGRAMANQSALNITGYVSNTNLTGNDLQINLSDGSGQLATSNWSPSSATATAGNSTSYTATVATGATLGNQTFAVTETDGAASNGPQTSTQTLDVVTNRVITVPGVNLGRFIKTSAVSGTSQLSSTTGDSTTMTNITVTGAASATVSGIKVAALSPATLNAVFNGGSATPTNSLRTVSGTWTGALGAISTNLTLARFGDDGASLNPLTGESDQAITVAISGNALQNRVITVPSVNLGRFMAGFAIGASNTSQLTSTTGDDASNTRITLSSAGSSTDANGLSVAAAGGSALFNGSANPATNSLRTITGTVTAAGAVSGSLTLSRTGESLTGEVDQAIAISYSGNALQNRTVTASTVNFGAVHQNSTTGLSTNLSTLGADTANTRVTVGGTLFNSAASTGTASISPNFSSAGTVTAGTVVLPTTGEGLPNEAAVNVNVSYNAQVFSGKQQWATGAGNWGTNPNWTDTLSNAGTGAPGLSGALSAADTALFSTSGTGGAVDLNATSPHVAAITFGGSNAYTISASSGTLNLDSSGTATITAGSNGHAISAPVNLVSNSSVSVTNSGDIFTISGLVSGTSKSLTIGGAGTTVLNNGSNSYSGGTTLSSGTLRIANTSGTSATGSGDVLLNGGTLTSSASGSSISGSLNAGSGFHTIAPGGLTTIGNFSVGGLSLSSKTTLNFDITSTSVHDMITDNGQLAATSGVQVAVPGGLNPGNYELASYSTLADGTTASNFSIVGSPAHYSLTLQGGQLDLVVANPNASNLFLTPTHLVVRSMVSGSQTGPVTLSNQSSTDDATFSVTQTTGDVIVSPTSGSVLHNNGSQILNVGFQSYATTGQRTGTATLQNTVNASDSFNSSGNVISLDAGSAVVDNRVVTGSLALGRVVKNQNYTANASLATTGDDNHFTRVTVASQSFNSVTSTGTASITTSFATQGTSQNGSQTTLTTTGEGLNGESPNNVTITPTATNVLAQRTTYSATSVNNSFGLANFVNPVSVGGSSTVSVDLTNQPDATFTRITVAASGTNNGITATGPGSAAAVLGQTASASYSLSGSFTGFGTSGTISVGVTTGESGATNDQSSYSPVSIAYSYTAGQTGINNSNDRDTFGTALTASVARNTNGPTGVSAGSSYAGLASAAAGTAPTGTGSDIRGAYYSGNSGPQYGGTAEILAGVNNSANGGAATVSMQWRTRVTNGATPEGTLTETNAGVGTSLPGHTAGLISDIVNLTGLAPQSESAPFNTPHGSDAFVMDMSYNNAGIPKHGADSEAGAAFNGNLYLVTLNGQTWENATFANSGNLAGLGMTNYQGSFQSFVANNGELFAGNGGGNAANVNLAAITSSQLASVMGAWGVDIGTHEAWAVVDHNSEFAVVPEPQTLVLAALGIVGLAIAARRKQMA